MRPGLRVIVCGGRDLGEKDAFEVALLRRTILELHRGVEGPIRLLLHGNARGADSEAQRVCVEFKIPVAPVPAQWSKYGRSAGPKRNQQMLGQSPDLVLAFRGGRGTADMVKRARKAGVEVREIIGGLAEWSQLAQA